MNKRNRVLFISAIVAAVAITAAYLYLPVVDEHDAQGAIGAVEKHHEQQITSSDVVLGDEQERKQEAALYGELLADSLKLESISADLGSFAESLGSASFDRQNIASFSRNLDSHFDASANESLGIVSQLMGRAELASFSENLESMQRAFENRNNLGLRQLESFEQMAANMAESLEARQVLESESMMEAHARLEGFSQQLENHEEALDNRRVLEMSENLESMTADLEARQQLEARVLESRMIASKLQQLEARVLEQKVLLGAKNHLQELGSLEASDLASRASELSSFSEQLSSRAAALESRALNNMQARYEMRALESRMLENMELLSASLTQDLQGRTNLEARSLQNLTAALGMFDRNLANRQPMFAQRFMLGLQSELAAISSHLEGRERLGSREFALGARQQLESRALAAKNLGSFNQHLENLSTSLESRFMVENKQSSQLGIQAQQLQSRTADLQSRYER